MQITKSRNTKLTAPRAALAAALTAILLTSHLSSSRAQPRQQETPEEAQRMADSLFTSNFAIDDANPEGNVPSVAQRNAAPLDFAAYIMELSERADRAGKRGDHVAVAKYYRAITKSVPDRALGYSQLCAAYEAAGARDEALEACANALSRTGVTLADFSHYVRLVLAERGEISPQRIKDLDALMSHLKLSVRDSLVPAQLRCEVGVRLLDVGRLQECTASLGKLAPDDPKTLGYEWTLALRRHDYAAATLIVERSKHSAMRPDAIKVMERVTHDVSSPWLRALELLRSSIKLALSGLALVLLVATAFAWRRPRALRWERKASTNSLESINPV